MMKQNQVINKAQQGEGLTVEEIKVYQEVVKPVKQVYGKYGTLKKKFLEKNGIEWMIADLPKYLHGIDKQAEEMYIVLQSRLEKTERFKRTGNFVEDYHRLTEMQRLIDEEILNEIVYVGDDV